MNNLLRGIGIMIVTIVAAVAPLYPMGRGEAEEMKELNRHLPAKPALYIELVSADCVVETGPAGEIAVRVVHSYPEGRYEAEIRESVEELRLRERFPGKSSRGSATWRITVPERTRVFFSSASGDFESRGNYEELDARSASGGISVRDLMGRIEINTASGEIRLQDIAGDVSISTASGEVEGSDISGRIRVRTASGDIGLKDVVVEIEASTASGKIAVSELRLAEEGNFNSASGYIEVGLGKTPAFDLTLTSASGKAMLDFNENALAGTFEFSALQRVGHIESPFAFHSEETFIHAGQTYDRKIFTRGSAVPRIVLATASGRVELKR